MSKGLLLAAMLAAQANNLNFIKYEFEASHKRNLNTKSRFKQRMAFKKHCKPSKK
jgi:hypothetical protein